MKKLEVKLHWTQIDKIAKLTEFEEARVVRRVNILSCLHNNMTTKLISTVLHFDPKTVTNVANVYRESGLDRALYDYDREGRPIYLDDRDRSRIIAKVCTEPPAEFYRWTLKLIVETATNKALCFLCSRTKGRSIFK